MINVENVGVTYDGQKVLRDISFELGAGEIVALIGPNGAGKTTLVRTLNAAVPLSSGEIRLDGRKLSEYSRREIARRVAVVAQENETKFPVTVLEFVLSGRFAHGRAFGWETAEDVSIAENALRQCDLGGFEGRLMNELSGGERQRVVLARALATGAEVLLLDEPTANLDLKHQALMFKLVKDRCRGSGAAAMVITHDLNLAAEFADRVILLDGGKVIADGTPEEVLTKENIHTAFDVNVLLDSNPSSRKLRVTNIFR